MKINKKNGTKWNGDNIFTIETKGEEAFAMDKFLILINQLSLNEFKGYREKGYKERELPFFFECAIIDVIKLGKEGIDLLDNKNDFVAEQLCDKYFLDFTKWKQTKITEFISGSLLS